jgi:hypothetical protein
MDWGKIKSKFADIAKTRLPFLVATGGEFIALYFWLVFFDQGSYLLATIVLWAGFLTERIAVLVWVNLNFGDDIGIAAKDKPWWQKLIGLLAICLSEITVWVIFVLVYDHFGVLPAFVVLFIGEQIEHSVELGLLSESDWKKFVFSRSATMITLLEALGGLAWLYLVRHGQPQLGGLLLLLGLTIEHVVQGNAIKEKFLQTRARKQAAKDAEQATGSANGVAAPVPQS